MLEADIACMLEHQGVREVSWIEMVAAEKALGVEGKPKCIGAARPQSRTAHRPTSEFATPTLSCISLKSILELPTRTEKTREQYHVTNTWMLWRALQSGMHEGAWQDASEKGAEEQSCFSLRTVV